MYPHCILIISFMYLIIYLIISHYVLLYFIGSRYIAIVLYPPKITFEDKAIHDFQGLRLRVTSNKKSLESGDSIISHCSSGIYTYFYRFFQRVLYLDRWPVEKRRAARRLELDLLPKMWVSPLRSMTLPALLPSPRFRPLANVGFILVVLWKNWVISLTLKGWKNVIAK